MNGVVALSASQGTGKTELARALAGELHCTHASVSSYVASRLQGEGQHVTPHRLRDMGERLARDPVDLTIAVLAYSGWTPGASLVFDSIRHGAVLDALREHVAPQVVLHVGLNVPEAERERRLRERGREPYDRAHSEHSTEVQVPVLVEAADIVLDGTRSTDQLVSEVLVALRR